MKFEEQFPGLASIKQDEEGRQGLGEYYSEDIQKHCLDKQRVIDGIMRLPDDNRRFILLKELGLEDTQIERSDMDDFVNPGVTIELIQKYHIENGDTQ